MAKRNSGPARALAQAPPSQRHRAGQPGDPLDGARASARAAGRPARRALVVLARRGPATVRRDRDVAGERPQAPWHPLPLSELLILVGAIGAVVGLRGVHLPQATRRLLLAGIAAVAIGTLEVTAARAPQRLPLAHRCCWRCSR